MTPTPPYRLAPGSVIARHRHAGGYAMLVVAGAYEEAGDKGRFRVEAGDVLLHAPSVRATIGWLAPKRSS